MANNGNRNDQRINRFAELLSQDMRPSEVGEIMGLTRGQTANCWRTIKADLGWQAR